MLRRTVELSSLGLCDSGS